MSQNPYGSFSNKINIYLSKLFLYRKSDDVLIEACETTEK